MARLTVEDCLTHVANRFDLVMKASERAKKLERGAEAHVAWDNDKPTVVALREIAAGLLEEKEEKKEEGGKGEEGKGQEQKGEIEPQSTEEMQSTEETSD